MPHHFQKPENALKRANEFIEVGKQHRALAVLLDVIKSRRHRTWQKIHEPIILKYLSLCVELKKSHLAKEGLFHYRNICQHVNTKSLEEVVRYYLKLAEDRTERARTDCHHLLPRVDDLDNVQTPESVIFNAVVDSRDQPTITVLTPWVKFLWESYKHCLELLRNNSKVERLYHDIAQKAMGFCVVFERKTEFRKLYDNLRSHRHGQQAANPESQAMHLETRMVQLDTAINMELWQEAFKAIEDINTLIYMLSKSSKISLLATYYQKVALVFWKAENILFHASSLLKYFHLMKETKRHAAAELQNLASRVVIAVLAIPQPSFFPETDFLVEKDESLFERHRLVLASLLDLSSPPSKSTLIRDLMRFGLVNQSHPLAQELFKIFVKELYPINICALVADNYRKLCLEIPDLKQYEQPIQDIALVSVLKTLSHVYVSLKFGELTRLVPFAEKHLFLERRVVEAVKRNNLNLRIDHRNRCLHFRYKLGSAGSGLDNARQSSQLASIGRLYTSLQNPMLAESCREAPQHCLIEIYEKNKEADHKVLLERRYIIEERKELLETLCLQREEEERRLLEQKQQKLRAAELERMSREAEERAKQRILNEQNELRKRVALEKLEQLKKTDIGAQLFERLEKKLEKIDSEEILYRQLEKEKRELALRLRKQERTKDHFERAKRLEEIPLLKRQYEAYKIEARAIFERSEEDKINEAHKEYQLNLQHKYRMQRIIREKDKILNIFKAAKNYEYQVKLYKFNEVLGLEREKRLYERMKKRKEERKKEWLILREELEKKRKLEKRRLAEEAHKAKLDEIESKKRAKEQEVEDKLRRERENQLRLDKLKEEQRFVLWKPAASLWKASLRREEGAERRRRGEEWTRSDASDWRCHGFHSLRICDGRSSRSFDFSFESGDHEGGSSHEKARTQRDPEGKQILARPDCLV